MATHSSILAWKIPWTEEPGCNPWGHKESDTTELLTFSPSQAMSPSLFSKSASRQGS